jgi:hypothetical protein
MLYFIEQSRKIQQENIFQTISLFPIIFPSQLNHMRFFQIYSKLNFKCINEKIRTPDAQILNTKFFMVHSSLSMPIIETSYANKIQVDILICALMNLISKKHS